MGKLTRAQIVSEGLLAAGDARLTSRANVWLNAWLRSNYAGFPWPFLLRSVAGVALDTGDNQIELGGGSGGVTAGIRRIIDPMYVYTSDKRTRRQVRIYSATEVSVLDDPDLNDSSERRGLPSKARVKSDASTWGKWTVTFDVWADRDLLVKVQYYEQPDDIDTSSGGDSTIPIYPNDRTLMKCVEAEALRYKKADNYQNELDVLAAMVVDDRMKYGTVAGQNDWTDLDPTVYR